MGLGDGDGRGWKEFWDGDERLVQIKNMWGRERERERDGANGE